MAITSRVRALPRIVLASMLMLTIVSMSFPAPLLAQEVVPPPVDDTTLVAPTCSLSADPSSIVVGESTTLSLSATDADAATLSSGDSLSLDGSVEVTPTETTTYTATVTGEGGSAECSVEVTVEPVEGTDTFESFIAPMTMLAEVEEPPYEDTVEDGQCHVVSDSGTLVTTNDETDVPASVLTFVHTGWDHSLESVASWIWGDNPVEDPTVDETQTFTKIFSLPSASAGTLTLASDNGYAISVNGTQIVDELATTTATFNPTVTYTVPLVAGVNTLEITVINKATPGDSNPENNPAGLIYTLTATEAECGEPEPAPTPICEAGVELLQNGSFENPNVSGSGSWNVYPSGTSGLDWMVEWLGASLSGRPAVANLEIQDGLSGWGATNGSQWAELDSDWNGPGGPNGSPSSVAIYQDIPTVPGKTYTLTFDFSARPGTGLTDNAVQALWNGTPFGSAGPTDGTTLTNTSWSAQSFSFVATSSLTRVTLKDTGTTNNSYGPLVDNASLKCVPVVVEQCNADAQTVILSSDGQTYDQTNVASIVTFLHEAWVDAVDALWIWKDATTSAADAANGTTETFTRQFTISGAPLDASLDVAVDNNVVIKVNGNTLTVNPEVEFNYGATTTYAVPAALMQPGLNTITFKVTNLDHATANDPETNPAGLLYKLTVHDNQCVNPSDPTVQVHIYKYLEDGDTTAQVPDNSTAPSFPMTATWSATNIGSGSGNYVLGNQHGGAAYRYAADTSEMTLGADYTTSEVTDGSVVVASAQQCSAGKYLLKGYRSGDSLAEAQTAPLSATAPVFNDITNDKYVIVVNEECGPGEVPQNGFKVHIFKFLDDGETETQIPNDAVGVPLFPMIATYDIAGVWTNLDPGDGYSLGNGGGVGGSDDGLLYAANTVPLSVGDDYGTYEVTDGEGSPVVGPDQQCVEGKYRLVGYRVGDTLELAKVGAISTTSPFFSNMTDDKYVIVVNEDCDTIGNEDTESTITIVKNSVNGTGTFSFQVDDNATYLQNTTLDTVGDNTASTTYVVPAGTYDITETALPEGWTLSSIVCNAGTPIANGKTVTLGTGDDVTCTFTNTNTGGGDGDGDETTTSDYFTIRQGDLEDDIMVALSTPTWFMYNDSTDVIDNALGSFVTGPATAPAGIGSVEFTLAPNPHDRKNIATFQFQGTALANIMSLMYSAFSNPGTSGAGPTESPYLVFNIDFTGSSGAFQSRLVYVPANNGPVPQNGWNQFDAINGGAAMWVYSGATWPAAVVGSPDFGVTESGTIARSWSDIKLDYPNARLLPYGGFMGVRVGEPGPDGYTGDVDKFVIGIKTGLNTYTRTYDFEPEQPVTPTNEGGSGGGGGGNSTQMGLNNTNDNDDGEVQGAETGPNECVPLITQFLSEGNAGNTSAQVLALQNFLNGEMGLSIPLSGVFGSLTTQAVNAFQLKYWSEVLAPWVPFGLPTDHTPTGFVYKLTQWKINSIYCAPEEITVPQIP